MLDWLDEPHDPIVRQTWDRFLDRLGRAGMPVVPVRVPKWSEYWIAWRIMVYEAALAHRIAPWAGEVEYSDPVAGILDEGGAVTEEEYGTLRKRQADHRRRLLRLLAAGSGPLVLPLDTSLPRRTNDPPYSRAGQSAVTDAPDPGIGSLPSLAGLPALALPLPAEPGEPPLAIQLVGAPYTELALTRLGTNLEGLL